MIKNTSHYNSTNKELPNKASKRREGIELSFHSAMATNKDQQNKVLKKELDYANKTIQDLRRALEKREQNSMKNQREIEELKMKLTETTEQLESAKSELKCSTKDLEKRLEKQAKEHEKSFCVQARKAEAEKQKHIKEIVLEAEKKRSEVDKMNQNLQKLYSKEKKARLQLEEDLKIYIRTSMAEFNNRQLLKKAQEEHFSYMYNFKYDLTMDQIKVLANPNNQLGRDYKKLRKRLNHTVLENDNLRSELRTCEKVHKEKLERVTQTLKRDLQNIQSLLIEQEKAYRNHGSILGLVKTCQDQLRTLQSEERPQGMLKKVNAFIGQSIVNLKKRMRLVSNKVEPFPSAPHQEDISKGPELENETSTLKKELEIRDSKLIVQVQPKMQSLTEAECSKASEPRCQGTQSPFLQSLSLCNLLRSSSSDQEPSPTTDPSEEDYILPGVPSAFSL